MNIRIASVNVKAYYSQDLKKNNKEKTKSGGIHISGSYE